MPIEVRWDNPEKTVIIYEASGRWHWDELNEAIITAAGMMDEVSRTINIILDMTNAPIVPPTSPTVLRGLVNAPTAQHEHMGRFYITGLSTVARAVFNVFTTIYPKAGRQYQVVPNLEEARKLANQSASSSD